MTKHNLVLVALIASAFSSTAFAEDLFCKIKLNTAQESLEKVTVEAGSTVKFGENSGYSFKIKNAGNSKFEIDVFEPTTPSRSYAGGTLKSASDEVTWALWTRDLLLEASCQLAE